LTGEKERIKGQQARRGEKGRKMKGRERK
jgi:hypothetical protein